MAFGDTVRALREQRHLTQRQLGEVVGVSDKAVSTWENNSKLPRMATVRQLADYFGVSAAALLDGIPSQAGAAFYAQLERLCSAWGRTPEFVVGELRWAHGRLSALRHGDAPSAAELQAVASYFGVPVESFCPPSPAEVPDIRFFRPGEPLAAAEHGRRRYIPVLGRVPAGVPIEAVPDVVEQLELPERLAGDGYEYFALLVMGDSMFPEYRDGDIVILRVQETADSGDDVVAYIGGSDATLKRLLITAGGIQLRPLNPQYAVRSFTAGEVEALPVTIAGVVVEQRRMRRH